MSTTVHSNTLNIENETKIKYKAHVYSSKCSPHTHLFIVAWPDKASNGLLLLMLEST